MVRRCLLAVLFVLCGCAHAAANAARPEGEPSYAPRQQERGGADSAPDAMFDIRAKLSVKVDNLATAAAQLREVVHSYDGQLTADEVVSQEGNDRGSFDVRVPAGHIEAFLGAVAGLGHLLSRNVTATDVSKEYHDSGLLLENLRATSKRYEELLAKATDVKDMLAIETELGRVRGQIEKVEGERRWMEDHVARATVHVDLVPVRKDEATQALPTAKFYPGLRLAEFTQLGSNVGNRYGGGLSLLIGQRWSFDLDAFRHNDGGTIFQGADLFLATFGGDAYSDFFGGGQRTFFNPYIGFRVGYARIDGSNAAVLGMDVGLELVRLKYVIIDAQVAGLGILGASQGSVVGIQPSLTARFAF